MASPPVLLLHGWGGSFESTFAEHGWTDTLRDAGRSFIAIDLPGHGPTPASIAPADYADLSGMVATRLPAGTIDAVAYSLGAKVALALACSIPNRIRRLVLIGVGDNVFAPEAFAAPVISALEDGVSDATPPAVRDLVDYSRASGSSAAALAAVLRRPPNPVLTEAEVGTLDAKVQLINGADDAVALPDQRLRKALGHPAYMLFDDVDHLGLPRAQAVRQAAVNFLNADAGQCVSLSRTPSQAI